MRRNECQRKFVFVLFYLFIYYGNKTITQLHHATIYPFARNNYINSVEDFETT